MIWTDLPPKFKGEEGRIPTVEEVADYLTGLPGDRQAEAFEYIRKARPQIDTAYRRELTRLVPETAVRQNDF